MAELMQGQPLFPGESGIDQLVEIIKVLGTPTREQIKTMNPNYMEHKFPQIRPHPFSKVFRPRTPPDAIDLISRLLEYTPSARLTAIEAICHPFFDELRTGDSRMPNGRDMPPLFNWTKEGERRGPRCSRFPLFLFCGYGRVEKIDMKKPGVVCGDGGAGNAQEGVLPSAPRCVHGASQTMGVLIHVASSPLWPARALQSFPSGPTSSRALSRSTPRPSCSRAVSTCTTSSRSVQSR